MLLDYSPRLNGVLPTPHDPLSYPLFVPTSRLRRVLESHQIPSLSLLEHESTSVGIELGQVVEMMGQVVEMTTLRTLERHTLGVSPDTVRSSTSTLRPQ